MLDLKHLDIFVGIAIGGGALAACAP